MIAGPKFEGLGGLISLVYPSLCTVCRVDTRAAEYLCDQCETKTVRIVSPLRYLVACWLTAALDDKKVRGLRFDVIIPVPLHPARQREPGFKPGELARGIA